MSADDRSRLAEQQAELLLALTGAGPPPEGFDPDRVEAAAESLAQKRLRAVARAWPGLTRSLGGRFAERFAVFADRAPLPPHGGPLADGRAFARWLARTGDLPNEGKLEALTVDLHFAGRAGGLVPRRGPVLTAALLRKPRRLVLAVRLPGLELRWLAVPLGFW